VNCSFDANEKKKKFIFSGLKKSEHYTVKMNILYLINRIVATDYKQYY